MKVLVIEDEKLASERLVQLITELEPEFEILQTLDSVRATVHWLKDSLHPDLIFLDIQLADGVCFDIFEKVEIDIPVIFTTAYNKYALRAFKVNSIDYLLKPIDKEELRVALVKFKKLSGSVAARMTVQPELLKQVMKMIHNPYKSRFAIHIGEHIKTIFAEDVAFFHSSDKSSFLRSFTGRDYAIDLSLEQLGQELDPQQFFRISRKYIVALPHIKDIVAYSGNRLRIYLNGGGDDEILVSREKVSEFKRWLDK